MKKKIIVVILIIFLVLIGIISYFSYNYYIDNKEKKLLQNEVAEINKYITSDKVDIEKIKKIITPDITTKNCLAVEEALEKYILDCATTINTAIALLQDEKLTNLLGVTNYQSDGPNFTNSKAYIAKTKEELQTAKGNILSLTDESKILAYFNNPTKDDYYEQMYRSLAIDTGLKDNDIKAFSSSIDSVINLLNISEETLNFLSQNSTSWQIQNNQIYFTNENLLNTYNNYIAKIK